MRSVANVPAILATFGSASEMLANGSRPFKTVSRKSFFFLYFNNKGCEIMFDDMPGGGGYSLI